MSMLITLILPAEGLRRADRLAHLAGRSIGAGLGTALEIAWLPLTPPNDLPLAVASLSAAQVVALTKRRLDLAQDRRLSELLDQQQSGALTDDERTELTPRMQIDQAELLRPAHALREAVNRGLPEPLAS